MILRSVRLTPFAGWREKEVRLSEGLNVICGPNEAGKSTLFRAIDSVLFLPTKLRANTIEGRELRRLIPIGGDHARVSLELETDSGAYLIDKLWGSSSETKLTLPDGSALTDPARIDEMLRRLIPTSPGTFRSVLLTPQNALEGTIEELSKNGEPLHSLGDVLRAAVNRTDGVSVDRLKAQLEKRIEDAFLNWDIAANAPKKLRGIENPWERQGPVLQSYYARERLKKLLIETQALERSLGEKTKALDDRVHRLAEAREFVEKNEKSVDAVAARQALSLRQEQAERDAAILAKDFDAWVRAESDRKVLEPEVARLEGVVRGLAEEMKSARAEILRQSSLARFEKIEAARKIVEEKRAEFAAIPRLAPDELNRLRAQSLSLEKLRAGLSASKLVVSFLPKREMAFSIRRDLEPAVEKRGESGAAVEIRAGGRVRIDGEDFELVIVSGDGDLDRLEKSLRTEGEALAAILAKHGLESIAAAQARSEKWMSAGQAMRAAESALTALLGGEPYERIEAQAKAALGVRAARDPEVVEREYSAANAQLAAKKGDLLAATRLLQDLGRRHLVTESSALMLQMMKKGVEQQTLKTQLETLAPLPEGIGDVAEYIGKFKRAQAALPGLGEEIRVLGSDIVETKAKLPEQSAQEFDRRYRDAVELFDRELKAGRALLRVGDAMASLAGGETDVYGEFGRDLESYVGKLSGGRYERAKMEGSLPVEFLRQDGAVLPYGWLSAGTKDCFALSLRLAMARYFLSGSKGFLLMDDPMVAMDPERQKIVAAMLREFADKAQLVVFTCHPGHAELLGGNRLDL